MQTLSGSMPGCRIMFLRPCPLLYRLGSGSGLGPVLVYSGCALKLTLLTNSVKVASTAGHVSDKVFSDHWTHHYGRFTDRNQPIAIKVRDFQTLHSSLKVSGPKLGNVPPWLVDPPRTNDKLTNEISRHEGPEALLALSNCLIDSYSDHTRVYRRLKNSRRQSWNRLLF